MVSLRSINPVVRASMVMAAVVVLAGGVTYAALQSQATLTDNTITSATADLQVDNTDDASGGLGSTDEGFAFTNVVPGGAGSNVGNFSLKNGSASTPLTVSLKLDAAPSWTTTPAGAVDNSKVHVIITRGAGTPKDIKLSDLIAGNVSFNGGPIAPGATETFTVQVKMDADAFTGSSASASAFQFVFTGTGV